MTSNEDLIEQEWGVKPNKNHYEYKVTHKLMDLAREDERDRNIEDRMEATLKGFQKGFESGCADTKEKIIEIIKDRWEELIFDLHIRFCKLTGKNQDICKDRRRDIMNELLKELEGKT